MPRKPRLHTRNQPLMELYNAITSGDLWLRPDESFNQRFIGILAKAQEYAPMPLHAGAVLEDRWTLLGSPETVKQQADFMCYFTRQLTLLAQRRDKNCTGPIFTRRYKAIEVSIEESAQIDRFAATLMQPSDAGLVASPLQWTGVPFAQAILTGTPLKGIWVDYEAFEKAKTRGEDVSEADFTEDVELLLEPLPCWKDLPPKQYRQAVWNLVGPMEPGPVRLSEKNQVLEAVPSTAIGPRYLVNNPRRSGAGLYATGTATWRIMEQRLKSIVERYRNASKQIRQGFTNVAFPSNCFPPSLPFAPAHP